MWRLIDRSKTPPRGFQWIDPITTFMVSARNHANWMADAAEHRVGNRNPIPSPEEMEDQYCNRLDPKTKLQYCQQFDGNELVKSLGVGSTLKMMLANIGVSACWGCINLANRMDGWGPDGCEEHMTEILEIMDQNAQKRDWYRFVPFKEQGSRMLVNHAIKRVREQQ